ncbi:hypothetical protein E2C01_082721 [Portunus trituberculatus]|uniref:Uncharacterized protein n=1 Tax=Portunus trituberculatus TaxID=210409 RepID=A0A5B7IVB0_PORTR|nr:hypothetical protein [Portunus trituberculatus]
MPGYHNKPVRHQGRPAKHAQLLQESHAGHVLVCLLSWCVGFPGPGEGGHRSWGCVQLVIISTPTPQPGGCSRSLDK